MSALRTGRPTKAEQDAVFQRLNDLGQGFQPDLYDVAGEVVMMLREATHSRPALDPGAVESAIRNYTYTMTETVGGIRAAADAVMDLAVPVPTREQIDALLQEWKPTRPLHETKAEDVNYRRRLRNSLLALFKGNAK